MTAIPRIGSSKRITDRRCGVGTFDPCGATGALGEGTRLDPSIMHWIKEGRVDAATDERTTGTGSRVQLSRRVERATDIESTRQAAEEAQFASALRVHYVDDELALVFLARRTFFRLGYSIAGFTDAQLALKAFRAAPNDYDIVVTDLSMPQMSGFEFASKVLNVRPDVPILMTSDCARKEDEGAEREIGVREIVRKPFTLEELGGALNRLFRDSHD
jgi:CheY-like chemotaxis protein